MPLQTESFDERWAEYARAHARIHLNDGSTIEAAPTLDGAVTGDYPDASGRTICIITADNPGGDVSAPANMAAHARLLERADELNWEYWHAHGGDAAWTHVEACIAVVGAPIEHIVAIGAEFAQDAIFVWTPKRWSLVSCIDDKRYDFGWRAWLVDVDAGGPTMARALS